MFVGRGELLAKIQVARGEFCANDLSGRLGTGKTSILRHLEDHTREPRPISVNLEVFNPGHPGEHGDRVSVGAAQGSFQYFSELLKTLVRRTCSQEALERFQADVTNAQNAEVEGAKVFGIKETMEEFEGALHPQDLVEAWRSAKDVVADSFVFHWSAATTPKGHMLLIDNVDEVADQEIGIWLGELLPRLAQTTVVLTRTPEGPPFPLTANAVRVFEVADFDEGEVREYLATAAQLADKPITDLDFLARKVYEVSGGHPATLGAIYELLWGSNADPGADSHKFLRDLPERPDERAAVLVERLVRRLDDDVLERALWAAAVPRQFDALLLNHLLATPELASSDQRDVFDKLGGFKSFTEKLPPDNARLRLHSYVRTGLLQRMRRNNSDRFDALHELAANYYGDELTVAGNRYGEAFIYEDPKWQQNKREWLYHLGYATSTNAQRKTLLEFTRVFLDAFWWWGCYVHFDFCDQLIADLAHLAKHRAADVDKDAWPKLEVLYRALRRILYGYPLRSVKSQDADWQDMRAALLTVQRLCGLQARDDHRLTKNERHVAALLFVFLAHTWRYPARERPEADQYYSRAAALFAQDKDWSEAWVAFERAELRFERGEADAVTDLWRHAAELVQPLMVEEPSVEVAPEARAATEKQAEEEHEVDDEPDEELVSLLCRLRGDCCWESGDRARSAMWYGRAVLHAYRFHLVCGPQPDDHSPDAYTLQFYVDIRARALNRLFHVWKRGDQDAAVGLAIEMARAFPATYGRESGCTPDQLRELLADGTPVPLAHALFPRGPDVWELGNSDSEFTQEVDTLVAALDLQRPSGDLHDTPWP